MNFPERPKFDNDVYIIYSLDQVSPEDLLANEKIGVQPTEVNKLFGLNVTGFPGKFVIRQPVTFKNKHTYNLHRLLRAIDRNTLLSKLDSSSTCRAF
jgi:DNA polymerase-3 subunit alpha